MNPHEDFSMDAIESGTIKCELEGKDISEGTPFDVLLNSTALNCSRDSKENLLKCFEDMISEEKIHITWNNVRTLLVVLHLTDTDVTYLNRVKHCVEKLKKQYMGDIPKDIDEWFKDI